MKPVVLETSFPEANIFRRGKVRDMYEAGPDRLLMVATDRISAFDVVMPNGIPGKGQILTGISVFWFDFLKNTVKNHLISTKVADFPAPFSTAGDTLEGRSMLIHRTQPIEVECVVRGYLCGSGWKDYQRTGSVCGIKLPDGLEQSQKLPEPIFTPATKAHTGHDENISFEVMAGKIGQEKSEWLRNMSLSIYQKGAEYAAERGIILADTKFEFGDWCGEMILIDEALTPDSSRFWLHEDYKTGISVPSLDKQFVRDYLETLDWDKTPPGPTLPDEVIEKTLKKYQLAYRLLTE